MSSRYIAIGVGIVACLSIGLGVANWRKDAWTPPKTSLGPEWVDATRFAFDHDVPDPRGGEFREVTLRGHKDGARAGVERVTTGWVTSSVPGKEVVVTWNGLTEHPVKVGVKKDLATFVEEQCVQVESLNKRPSGAIAPSQPTETVAPLGVAMALRLGRGDLAERIAGVIKLSPRFVAPKVVDDILWARYSRALGHFERGDDASARDDCRWLQTNAKAFIGFGKVSGDGSPSGGYQFQALCADLDRRLQNRSRPPFDSAKNRALPVERRVAEIVDRLEDARGTMECVPGPIRWDGDPVYEAALEIGEPLVDALLDRAEKDSRLTRAVGISGAGPRVRSLVPVRELASRLVVEIADLPVWSAANPGWEALKAQWRATKGLQPAERLLWVLRNDDAGPARWCDAAMRLVKNEYVDLKTGRIVRVGMKTTVRPVLRMKGAPLRSRRNPSVTELMAKRALQTMPKGKWESEADSTAAQQAGDMARSMELWDPVGSKKTRRELSARLSRCVSELEGKPSRWDKDARAIIEVLAKPAARG